MSRRLGARGCRSAAAGGSGEPLDEGPDLRDPRARAPRAPDRGRPGAGSSPRTRSRSRALSGSRASDPSARARRAASSARSRRRRGVGSSRDDEVVRAASAAKSLARARDARARPARGAREREGGQEHPGGERRPSRRRGARPAARSTGPRTARATPVAAQERARPTSDASANDAEEQEQRRDPRARGGDTVRASPVADGAARRRARRGPRATAAASETSWRSAPEAAPRSAASARSARTARSRVGASRSLDPELVALRAALVELPVCTAASCSLKRAFAGLVHERALQRRAAPPPSAGAWISTRAAA